MPICSYCKNDGRLAAKGLCGTCYARFQRNGSPAYVRKPEAVISVAQCSHCHSPDGPFIKTLCRPCYQRQWNNGTPELQRTRQLCEMPGCDEVVHSKGFCQKHNMRLRRRGDPNAGRPEDWGARSKHRLYERWQSMKRLARRDLAPEWKDFWRFVGDVGEPPTADHRLYRISASLPYGPKNTEWRRAIGSYSATDREAKNAYMRSYGANATGRVPDLRKG